MHTVVHPALAAHLLTQFGGVISLVLGQVELYIDATWGAYIQAGPDADLTALIEAERVAKRWGYEVMGEDEGGVEDRGNGILRHWLAMTHEALDKCGDQFPEGIAC